MPFGRVNIVEFDLVGHRFDASAQGKLVPVACDYRDRLELQAPGQVRMAAPKRSRRRGATFAIIRSVFVKIAVRIEELKRSIKLEFPRHLPHVDALALITSRLAAEGS